MGMYLRTYKRKNKNGTTAEYYQLAHNEYDPGKKQTVAQIIHNFGRADVQLRDGLFRLCQSIARVCGFKIIDSPARYETCDTHKDETSNSIKNKKNRITAESTNAPITASRPEKQPHGGKERVQESYAHEEKDTLVRQITEELNTSEEKFRIIFENAQDMISFVDLDGKILDINPAVERLFGVTPEYAIGKHFSEIENLSEESIQKAFESQKHLGNKNFPKRFEGKAFHKDGSLVLIEVTIRERKGSGPRGLICVIRDITKRKLAEEALLKHKDRLEELVKERTANLEEANTALKVLLKQKDEHKSELEDKVLANVNELILPNLQKLKTIKMDPGHKTILDIIEGNLQEIVSSSTQKLSSRYYNFTSTELRIANLIKYGKTTKDMAELLHLSPRTVEFHRNNIRKKLGIKNRKVNIRTYLLSLE